MSDATAGIAFLPKPWNDVHMRVHVCLSPDRTAVPPHIITIRMISIVHPRFDSVQQRKGRA